MLTSRLSIHSAGLVRNGTVVDVVPIAVCLCGSVSAVAKEEVNRCPKILSQVLGRKGQCNV